MDTDTKDTNVNGCILNNNAEMGEGHHHHHHHHHANGGGGGEQEVGDSYSLLPPQRGCMSRNSDTKTRRKVQWTDNNGDKLAEVLEYEPSDVSDSEDEDSYSCICTIM